MAKRSDGEFERVPNDLYRTFDPRAVRPLLPHLDRGTRFVEPCAGHGDLVRQLVHAGHKCVGAYDIDPKEPWIKHADAQRLIWPNPKGAKFITNPPWTRDLLHTILLKLCRQAPTWLLFDADWLYTSQSEPYLIYLHRVIAVGRVRWIPDTTDDGKDNCAWYLFGQPRSAFSQIEFFGRT